MPRAVLLLAVFALAGGAFWLLSSDGEPSRGMHDDEAPSFPEDLPATEPPSDDPWTDPDWLVPHFERAAEAVEAICGARFDVRPTLRVGSGEDLADLYWLTAREYYKQQGEEPPPFQGNEKEFAKYARTQFGRYFREVHAITVSREALENYRDKLRDSLHGGDGVKLVLVHELAHAWQYERFPKLWTVHMLQPDKEAANCAWAMIEGHAQHVTARVARKWGMRSQFADFRTYYEDTRRRSRMSENHRNYVQGQAFMDALRTSGGDPRVLEALAHPARTYAELEDASLWLKRREAERDAAEAQGG